MEQNKCFYRHFCGISGLEKRTAPFLYDLAKILLTVCINRPIKIKHSPYVCKDIDTFKHLED